ncbi:MAG TPA: DHHA1 domain-containing protein, partial [Thermoplasmata archaeon]|nr:DHHA1 domain-containing protein [Thermoplasmata archaeon]
KSDLESLAFELEGGASPETEPDRVRVLAARVPLDVKQLQELCRRLTRTSGRVAVLVSEAEETGRAIVGSSSPQVDAARVLAAMLPEFSGKGGGNPSVATAKGEPGAALERALEAGRKAAEAQATAAVGR